MDPDPLSLSYILLNTAPGFSQSWPWWLLIVLLLLLSALASGTEVAYFSLSQAEIEDYKKEQGRVWELLRKPRKLLATVLIFNNLVNVAIILISSFQLHRVFPEDVIQGTYLEWLLPVIEVGAITFLLLFFGEITPKVYASQNRLKIVRSLAVPMIVMRSLLSPISFFLIRSTRFLDKRISTRSEAASHEDIKHAIDLTSEEESPEEEKGILKGIVDFSSISVKSVMHSRVDIEAFDIAMNLEQVIDKINESGFSRMPVYEESLDTIKGILYVKDLLPFLRKGNLQKDWHDLIRPAYFVPETKKIDDLLEEFKSRRLHIAIVVDEFGGTSGLVTLEDIIEEIFGEIVDEFDDEEFIFSKLSDSEYVFDGKMPLNDIVKLLDLKDGVFEESKGDADSLAGLILELYGKIPEKGEIVEMDGFRFYIESVAQNRIKRVKMEILEMETNEENGLQGRNNGE